MSGPPPERRANLLGHRSKSELAGDDISHAPAKPVKWYHVDPDWHPIAKNLYLGAKRSGQAVYYQQSDVALLFSIADDLSNYKNQGRRSPTMAAAIYSAMTGLLLSEGDRRRARVELEMGGPTDDAREQANDFYAKLGLSE